jgi:uncharacterized protein involved in response to NO
VLVSIAALLRITASLLPELYSKLLGGSGIAWTLAFVLFLFVYGPILTTARPDGRPG